ncbi:sensor domain-containing diguanylate cyclase [Cellulomonas endophytica]|uniref:GGDEF domain-containing protein n=1 Tax=Cellulomonas endophytica TaxID=2494735 RepID=UPI00101106AB|nr:GGDEF domain-containing protein [Cellulomonas endophytica]
MPGSPTPGLPVPVPEFGPFDPLSDDAHEAYIVGDCAAAVRMARTFRRVTEPAGDVVTTRYLYFTEIAALTELGRPLEALGVAADLVATLDDDEPVWRAKTLARMAEAHLRLNQPADAVAALAEAHWLLPSIPAGSYGRLSASMAVAFALRTAELLERADEVLAGVDARGDRLVEALVAREATMLSAYWGAVLRIIDRHEESRAHLRRTQERALRYRTCAHAAGRPEMVAQAEVLEAYALLHLDEPALAAARARHARTWMEARPELAETDVLQYVLGVTAGLEGRHEEAQAHLTTMVADAERFGRPLWPSLGRAALADLDRQQHGESAGARLWAEVARAALRTHWAERESRFAYLRDQGHIRDLRALTESFGQTILEDPLTGLGNRRMLAHAVQAGEHESVVFVDLDDFKAVNDLHSHAVGDAVLRAVAEILRHESRSGDLLLRYGGDEFLVLPAGGPDAAAAVARRIHAAVLEHPWSELAAGLSVTVSIGIGHGEQADDLLHSADTALLRAKRAGRNRVVEAAS